MISSQDPGSIWVLGPGESWRGPWKGWENGKGMKKSNFTNFTVLPNIHTFIQKYILFPSARTFPRLLMWCSIRKPIKNITERTQTASHVYRKTDSQSTSNLIGAGLLLPILFTAFEVSRLWPEASKEEQKARWVVPMPTLTTSPGYSVQT